MKPANDFILGLTLFIAFIIFMALWLHFNLPETADDTTLIHDNSAEAATDTATHTNAIETVLTEIVPDYSLHTISF